MARQATAGRRAEIAERQKRALELRRAGWTYDDIAEELGYKNKGSAYKAVNAAIAAITREPAREVLELELARLDDMLAGLYEQARNGDVFAVDRVLKIMDSRARYLGIHDLNADTNGHELVKAAFTGFMATLQGMKKGDNDGGAKPDATGIN